jgi:ABC-type multidrug transport system ATPase subunit
MGHVDLSGVSYHLPDGRVLLDDVSFRVGEGAVVALVGANGSTCNRRRARCHAAAAWA